MVCYSKTTGHDLRKRAWSRLDTNSNAVESCEKELHTTSVVQRHLLTLCVCVFIVYKHYCCSILLYRVYIVSYCVLSVSICKETTWLDLTVFSAWAHIFVISDFVTKNSVQMKRCDYTVQTLRFLTPCRVRFNVHFFWAINTRSSAVADRPRDAWCHWIFCYVTQRHWRSCEMTLLSKACVTPYQYSIEIMSAFWDIQRQRMAWPWKRG